MTTRILIADDNPAVRTALRHLLESAGDWDVTEVENGRDALAKAQELKPDVVILDLVMPVMDGLAAARELSKVLPGVPLLMHTLHWSPQVELEGQKVGVRKVVPKTDSKGLIAAVLQVLKAEPSGVVAALTDGIPAVLPPPDITNLPPIDASGNGKPTDQAEPPTDAPPDEATDSRPPS